LAGHGCGSFTLIAEARMRRVVGSIAVCGLLVAVSPATANQVHYQPASFDQLLSRAQLVVVVRRAKPAFTVELVDITPPGQRKDAAKYPPYRRALWQFNVQKVLHPLTAKLPKAIVVLDADDASGLDLHRRYYVEKVSKSPIYERYQSKTSVRADKANEVILFLVELPGKPRRFGLAVSGAIEPATEEPAVRRALARRPAKATPVPEPSPSRR
jgi:hypothetical protein